MINEILSKYENFSDSLISEIKYRVSEGKKIIELQISCMNALNDYKFENIKLRFIDVAYVCFREEENRSITFISNVYINVGNDKIVFDFSPQIFGNGVLKENGNSDFKIKCKKIIYSIVE